MKPVFIIGMGLTSEDLTQKHKTLIHSADILVGGKHHLDFFSSLPAKKKEITKDIKGITTYIKRVMKDNSVVVLASGDPLFFGIGNVLLKKLGPENVIVCTNVSTVAAAFARIKESWNDAKIFSFHGRDHEKHVLESLRNNEKIAVFTDPTRNPAWIANLLIKNRFDHYKICVLEQLGTAAERINWYSPEEAVGRTYYSPNIVILKHFPVEPEKQINLHLGMPEEWFDHKNGLITKAEVRAVALSKLQLKTDHVLWDLGAGSGSVSIEAALFIRKGIIIAVEKDSERIKQIKKNKKRFKIRNLKIKNITLPNDLGILPEPDRIFIGGGGSDIKEIVNSAIDYLKPGGMITANTVQIRNTGIIIDQLKKKGFKTDVVQVQINRGQEMPQGHRFQAMNPVWIITGKLE